MLNTPFSGSYAPADVSFLLKLVQPLHLDILEKERFIQAKGGHYSEVLLKESAPSAGYVKLFEEATKRNGLKMAADLVWLSKYIAAKVSGKIALVSLARAGTPVGVLVLKALQELMGRQAEHFSISIIRDKGVDANALDYIRARYSDQDIVFIDGWTGKGVIGRELWDSVTEYNAVRGSAVSPWLHVLADIAGTAHVSATSEDYLLPSAVLNSTVSGLVSRTVLNEQVGPTDFHGCILYEDLRAHDRTQWFIDQMFPLMAKVVAEGYAGTDRRPTNADALARFVLEVQTKYQIADLNHIKPGVGEATRVLLRRAPRVLFLRDAGHEDTLHLAHLAKEKGVPIEIDPNMPCNAMSLIAKAD